MDLIEEYHKEMRKLFLERIHAASESKFYKGKFEIFIENGEIVDFNEKRYYGISTYNLDSRIVND